MFTRILSNKRIYLVLSRRQVYQMLAYIGKNNGNATCEVFDLKLKEDSEDLDIQADFTDETHKKIATTIK